jgi:predicted HTH transcriptional regulator
MEEFPDLSRKAARVIVYSGVSKLDTRIDQKGTRGYAVGFQGLVKFVMEQLPQNEVIEDALRREVKLVPEAVIRELVANALIHQEFTAGGASVMVEIYSNRVEISNPGEPVVPVERFIDGYQSRNERVADFMRRFGICEEKSSGIDRVIQTVEAYQLPAPDFEAGLRRTHVTIYGPREFDGMDRNDRIRACYQHCCLRYVMKEPMTNQSLRERFKLPDERAETASRIIRDTLDDGKIKLHDAVGASKRYARYVPYWA